MPKVRKSSLDLSIDALIKSNPLMVNYKKAIRWGVRHHHAPELMIRSLILFQDAGLFSGKSAKDNFKRAINFKFPAEMGEAMRILISILLPSLILASPTPPYKPILIISNAMMVRGLRPIFLFLLF